MTTLKSIILQEFKDEMDTTIRIFEAVTDEIFDFKPHEKSKTVRQLANHMSEIPSWVAGIFGGSELDWMQYTPPAKITTAKDLVATYKNNVAVALQAFKNSTEEDLHKDWTMKKEDFTFFTLPKYAVLRKLIINHTIHHRAQMGVYLRLNNISVPASYVSSADENLFA
ncbi:DinB family protein [Aquimarina agarivorans]|uniref:DinB family protein n=1 Tax=Aquimarina agarivorans TaxID=980584 RepID=UPI000248FCC7|nr:DinB family protein [Aquimarina agarivorans]